MELNWSKRKVPPSITVVIFVSVAENQIDSLLVTNSPMKFNVPGKLVVPRINRNNEVDSRKRKEI